MVADFSGNAKARSDALAAGDKNATDIAAFLSSANPMNWPEQTLATVLMTHVAQHIAQTDDINSGNYVAGARVWEAEVSHITMIADVPAQGLTKQFPKDLTRGRLRHPRASPGGVDATPRRRPRPAPGATRRSRGPS